MSMTLRAIIIIAELISFVVLTIISIIISYKKNKKLKVEIIYLIINFIIILSIFLFSYPSYSFFSYKKMILVSAMVIVVILFFMILAFIYRTNLIDVPIGFAILIAIIVIKIMVYIILLTSQIKIEDVQKETKSYELYINEGQLI